MVTVVVVKGERCIEGGVREALALHEQGKQVKINHRIGILSFLPYDPIPALYLRTGSKICR